MIMYIDVGNGMSYSMLGSIQEIIIEKTNEIYKENNQEKDTLKYLHDGRCNYISLEGLNKEKYNECYAYLEKAMQNFKANTENCILKSISSSDILRRWEHLLKVMRKDPRHIEFELAWKEEGRAPEIVLFTGNGVTILKKEEKLYCRYDTGALFGEIKEFEISEEEAHLIEKSEKDALLIRSHYEKLGKTRILPLGQS